MHSDIIQKAIERVRKKRGDDQSFKIKLLIASNIRRIMIEKNIKGIDLAEKLQCNESLISKWVSGQENFTIETLAKIAAALGVTYHELTNPYISVTTPVELSKHTVTTPVELSKHTVTTPVELSKQPVEITMVPTSSPTQKINKNQKKQTQTWSTFNTAFEMQNLSIGQHNWVSTN